jgi:hypothetical protein
MLALFHARDYTLPAAYALLPPRMQSDRASAMLLAIALQESDFQHRRQMPLRPGMPHGPARGFWQAEPIWIEDVLTRASSRDHAAAVLQRLGYPDSRAAAIHAAVEHNDTLACAFARLSLWQHRDALPDQHNYEAGWRIYLAQWRPGRPHPAKWRGVFGVAHDLVLEAQSHET